MNNEFIKKFFPALTIFILLVLLMKSCQTSNEIAILSDDIKSQKNNIEKIQTNVFDVAMYIQELTKTLDYRTTINDKNSSIVIQKEIIKRLKNK